MFAVNAKPTARIDAKRSGITKNDPKSVLCCLKLPVLVFLGRYRDISGFSFAADRHFNLSHFHFRLLRRRLTWSAFVKRRRPCGPLLHVPITKYKIIPNPNPNPNTKITVNTIPKQMSYCNIVIAKHTPVLHVPITKYKIIPNPNPNPNTKITVNTTPKQMQYCNIVIAKHTPVHEVLGTVRHIAVSSLRETSHLERKCYC